MLLNTFTGNGLSFKQKSASSASVSAVITLVFCPKYFGSVQTQKELATFRVPTFVVLLKVVFFFFYFSATFNSLSLPLTFQPQFSFNRQKGHTFVLINTPVHT